MNTALGFARRLGGTALLLGKRGQKLLSQGSCAQPQSQQEKQGHLFEIYYSVLEAATTHEWLRKLLLMQ
jgi:hypothetical protein